MTEIILFHHAQGRTDGVLAFAERLREAGHTVRTPDTYDGKTFDSLDDGLAYAREVGFQELFDRGVRAAESLPAEVVYAGFSLGVMPAQSLAQTRPGALGAVLMEACAPASEFGDGWPSGLPAQIHGMENDPFFGEEGEDIDAARALVAEAEHVELFLYPGDRHLFTDPSLASHDAEAAGLVMERVLAFLSGTPRA
jgi:dienelactone hydrolase